MYLFFPFKDAVKGAKAVSLGAVLAAAERMLDNSHIDVEPYLHQLVPALLTCTCLKRADAGAHRLRAGRLAAAVCARFGGDPRFAHPSIVS